MVYGSCGAIWIKINLVSRASVSWILREQQLALVQKCDGQTTVRLATAEHTERIASLCAQLGYPASPGQIERRITRILQDRSHAVYVAERPNRSVVGWVHVCARDSLVADGQAEIEHLVVDEEYRRHGIGQLLVEQAERWACEKGCQAICVRSNVVREGAHSFYEKIGYAAVKTQRAFRKALWTGEGDRA